HLNDVAGFIGPEVFRSREQLVRCCLEDIAMGKLHGLTIGLDVCSTLHMDVSLDDLGWCIDQIMPANPAYLMALPTRIDPMLGYLTTGYQDHVHIRRRFGYRVDDRMWQFYRDLGVVTEDGSPGPAFGDPGAVYLQYCRRRGDDRAEAEIRREAQQRMAEVRSRGVFLAEGHGAQPELLNSGLQAEIDRIYQQSRRAIWQEMDSSVLAAVPDAVPLTTKSLNRTDYILHPASGEELSDASKGILQRLLATRSGTADVQIVISDGLNALALMEADQLSQLLAALRKQLKLAGFLAFDEHLLLTSGRVRAGYRIGEQVFGSAVGRGILLHIIGERPGTGHHTMSIYMTAATASVWGQPGTVDHNITRVVSGIAQTALAPEVAAMDAVRILKTMTGTRE
ncbi:MAG TPA: ethanolamine ammonia-lyase, partial [Planctomycetaceae bacterium]|nr:ethanolamine ammonia-lyase [Planctomycetaceae bacterium]